MIWLSTMVFNGAIVISVSTTTTMNPRPLYRCQEVRWVAPCIWAAPREPGVYHIKQAASRSQEPGRGARD